MVCITVWQQHTHLSAMKSYVNDRTNETIMDWSRSATLPHTWGFTFLLAMAWTEVATSWKVVDSRVSEMLRSSLENLSNMTGLFCSWWWHFKYYENKFHLTYLQKKQNKTPLKFRWPSQTQDPWIVADIFLTYCGLVLPRALIERLRFSISNGK